MQPTRDVLIQLLREVNRSALGGKNLEMDEDLFKNGTLDSLTVVQFIVMIEKKFQIKVSSKDINYQSFTTLARIQSLIETKLKQ